MLIFKFLDFAEFGCNSCRKVLNQPLSMPCGHNFCKGCLEIVFAGQDSTRERKGVSGRSLRTQKVTKLCPTCKADISDFLLSPQVQEALGPSIIQYYFTSIVCKLKCLHVDLELYFDQINRQMEEIIQNLQNTASNEQALESNKDADEADDSKTGASKSLVF